MLREDIVEVILMLLCWIPVNVTCIIVIFRYSLNVISFSLDTQRNCYSQKFRHL